MLHVATMLHFMGTGQWATPFGSYKVITSGTNGFTYSPYSCAPVPSQRGCPRLIIQYSQLNHLEPQMRHPKQSVSPSCATSAQERTGLIMNSNIHAAVHQAVWRRMPLNFFLSTSSSLLPVSATSKCNCAAALPWVKPFVFT